MSYPKLRFLYAASDTGGLFIIGSSVTHALPAPVYCVQVDGAGRIFAGTDNGLRISSDGGSTWTTSLAGQTVNDIAITAPLYSF